jgi:hypothetical protein
MNPITNRFEALKPRATPPSEAAKNQTREMDRRLEQIRSGVLVRPNGEPVPNHWSVFRDGEHVVIKDYTFRVAYIGETAILFEPVAPMVIDPAGQ